MRPPSRPWPVAPVAALVIAAVVALTTPASAATALTRVSHDPYTGGGSQHRTQVEADTFSFGTTIVAAFQVGRFSDGGGATNIGWVTSTDGGSAWTKGFLAGITRVAGGPYDRVSDPSVAYDARRGTWMIASLAMRGTKGAAVVVSRSSDGGATFDPSPVTVAEAVGLAAFDKNWIACDNTPTSRFYGNCYVQWDDFGHGNRILMSTSTDGGTTWGPALRTADGARGLGGQPVVRPDGAVVVPVASASLGALLAFRSTDGGASWGASVRVATISARSVRGRLRSLPLPSAEVDGAGNVYVAWHDCRFRRFCRSNDIVMSTSADGVGWSPVARVPIDSVTSGADHFIPGLGVDPTSQGSGARLGLTYYFYPAARCTVTTCRLHAGYVSSADGGATWSDPVELAGPMQVTWLADTSKGYMVGDYVSTSFSGGRAHTVIAVAGPPTAGLLDEAMAATVGGMPVGPPAARL